MTASPVIAAQAQEQEESRQAQVARGELRSVDTAKKTLTIAVDGAQQSFVYTDETRISGAQDGAAGLATMSGRQVAVTYRMQGVNRVALAIEVASQG
jgi:hypothetical protein